jgi:hypothetical protein
MMVYPRRKVALSREVYAEIAKNKSYFFLPPKSTKKFSPPSEYGGLNRKAYLNRHSLHVERFEIVFRRSWR